MAQEVGYFENFPVFEEGPFVIVNANGYRIEVERKNHKCPVLPHNSVSDILWGELGYKGKTGREHAAELCDKLNQMVKDGRIVLRGDWWVAAGSDADQEDK